MPRNVVHHVDAHYDLHKDLEQMGSQSKSNIPSNARGKLGSALHAKGFVQNERYSTKPKLENSLARGKRFRPERKVQYKA